MSYTLYIVSKSVLYIRLVAIFNPGVSASDRRAPKSSSEESTASGRQHIARNRYITCREGEIEGLEAFEGVFWYVLTKNVLI